MKRAAAFFKIFGVLGFPPPPNTNLGCSQQGYKTWYRIYTDLRIEIKRAHFFSRLYGAISVLKYAFISSESKT